MKRSLEDTTNVLYIPLVDELAPSVLDAFRDSYLRPAQPKRSVLAADCILSSYADEVSTQFRTYISPTCLENSTKIRCMGSLGCKLIWTGKEARVNVEVGCLIHMLNTLPSVPDTKANYDLLDWFADYQWLDSQCVCAMDFDTGWMGMYAEHRLWKALAVLVGISVQKPIPSVIRSWFPAEMLHHFIRSVGEKKVRRIVSLVRQYQWKGCPDLVFWNGAQLLFVEVKSSTDTMKEDQRVLQAELRGAGFAYNLAVTQDTHGGRKVVPDSTARPVKRACAV